MMHAIGRKETGADLGLTTMLPTNPLRVRFFGGTCRTILLLDKVARDQSGSAKSKH